MTESLFEWRYVYHETIGDTMEILLCVIVLCKQYCDIHSVNESFTVFPDAPTNTLLIMKLKVVTEAALRPAYELISLNTISCVPDLKKELIL